MDGNSLEEQFDMNMRTLKLDLKEMEREVENQILANFILAEKLNVDVSDLKMMENENRIILLD